MILSKYFLDSGPLIPLHKVDMVKWSGIIENLTIESNTSHAFPGCPERTSPSIIVF